MPLEIVTVPRPLYCYLCLRNAAYAIDGTTVCKTHAYTLIRILGERPSDYHAELSGKMSALRKMRIFKQEGTWVVDIDLRLHGGDRTRLYFTNYHSAIAYVKQSDLLGYQPRDGQGIEL